MDGNSAKLNKTIVILTPGFAADEKDTTCIPALQDYVDTLHKTHPELRLFVLSFQYPFRKGWYKWKGVDVLSADGRNSKYLFKFRTWFRVYNELKRIHKKFGIDVIHSFWLTETALIAQYFTNINKVKHIATLFGQDAKGSNKYLKLLKLDKMTIVGISNFVSEKLKSSTGKEVDRIIHFGLYEEIINRSAAAKRPYDIIGVGSLSRLKNYELFVRIVSEIKREFPVIKAIIVGEGVEREKLEMLIKELNLVDNVELKGVLPREQAIDFMSQSKIFLHTSNYESAGYVFLEALTSGCELVSFEVGYAPTLNKVHYCRDANEMTSKIKSLLASQLEFNKEIVPTMRETVQKFIPFYLD